MTRLLLLCALVAALPRVANAQLRADAGTVINGRVAVRVNVTLSDDETPYYPVPELQLRFFRSAKDSVIGRTDEAGVATVMLAPGEYRLVSGASIEWKGARYSWSLPVTVRAGIAAIELTSASAARNGPVATPMAAHPPAASQAAEAMPASAQTRAPKDGTTGTLFSFFLTGGGQFYADEPGRGAALLVGGIGGLALAVAGSNHEEPCSYFEPGIGQVEDPACYKPRRGLIAVGLMTAVGTWIFSMADAGGAARRYNAKHGLLAQGVRPLIAPAPNGQARVGLSLSLR
jgi:hypothetical protein